MGPLSPTETREDPVLGLKSSNSRHIFPIIDLEIVHSAAHGGVSDSSLVENATPYHARLHDGTLPQQYTSQPHSEYEDAMAKQHPDSKYHHSEREDFRNHCATDYCSRQRSEGRPRVAHPRRKFS